MYLEQIGIEAPRLSGGRRKSHAIRSFGFHHLQRSSAGFGSYIFFNSPQPYIEIDIRDSTLEYE